MGKLLLILLLAGCVAPAATPITPQQLVALIVQITAGDLQATIDIANSIVPPDQEAVMCAVFLQGFIPTLVGTQHTFIPPQGVASTLETLRIGAMEATSGVGLSSAQHQALDIACGPLAISVAFQIGSGVLSLRGVSPSAFLQMLLALAHANLPYPVTAAPARAVAVVSPQSINSPTFIAPAYRPVPRAVTRNYRPSPPLEPTAAQIAAYGLSRTTGAHTWMMP